MCALVVNFVLYFYFYTSAKVLNLGYIFTIFSYVQVTYST